MFSNNDWTLVGRTKGFARDRGSALSKRVVEGELNVKDNAGLRHRKRNPRWWTWVRPLDSTV